MMNPGRLLIFSGVLLIIIGTLFLAGNKILPFFGRLPGDFVFTRRNTTVFVPFTTMLLLSALLTLILNLISRWMK